MVSRITSGIPELDAMLGGGYEEDAVTTVYGPAGSGKTNLVMLAAIAAVKAGKKVIYVDTEGGFSLERLRQLTPDHQQILDNTLFLTPTTFEEQRATFEKLRALINDKIGLIIVDTIGMLYRLERVIGDEGSHEFNRDLGLQMGYLNEIARKNLIPVLVSNQVYAVFDRPGQVNLVGGDMVKYTSKCLLELQPLHQQKRRIVLRKHRSRPIEQELLVEITQEGIRTIASSASALPKPTLKFEGVAREI